MKTLTIEILGTSIYNRGAELMTIAIADRVRSMFPGCRVVVPPYFGAYPHRARYGLYTTPEMGGKARGVLGRLYASLAPKPVRNLLGLVRPAEIDAVLDASGFAYSDQGGMRGSLELRKFLSRMDGRARRAKPLILMPQALGPFQKPRSRELMKRVVRRARIVCARDQQSYDAVAEVEAGGNLRKYPDFTLDVAPLPPREFALSQRFVAIVPNTRMIEMTSNARDYLAFLDHAVGALAAQNLCPIFVIHDAVKDRQVIQQMPERCRRLQVIEHSDPRVLKGVLGAASFVIGSRYHALISTLSQGVPAIGLGWSHKYPELFGDFNAPELMLPDMGSISRLDEVIIQLSDPQRRERYVEKISIAAGALKRRVDEMWNEIGAVLAESIRLGGRG